MYNRMYKAAALAESASVRHRLNMEKNRREPDGADIAAQIANLQKDEVDRFLREHLRRRDLHQVVANLNESAVSKDAPRSHAARKALKRLGFTD